MSMQQTKYFLETSNEKDQQTVVDYMQIVSWVVLENNLIELTMANGKSFNIKLSEPDMKNAMHQIGIPLLAAGFRKYGETST